ncbi:hypothetical protein N4T77_06680 [Clostridium sp. CX1]|uniref:hypothetical protein n=1 Tax=Clostridium sp. CX1 TaxID=2978346 RepID=UPI0021BEDFE2|nr:hypothetical protein [Clostridium sp. CX1]MCT8976278.1 hypothetical protein [Clostridium sp. CX1]
MLRMLLKKLIRKTCKPQKRTTAEDVLYPTQVYPLYLCVQQTFNYCIKNRLMKREDILYMKEMLNGFIKNKNYYKDIKFKNDVHEIYKKLKSHNISEKQMKKLLDFVNQFAVDIPEPIQTVQHLKVIK